MASGEQYSLLTWRAPRVGQSTTAAAAARAVTTRPDLEDGGARDEDRDGHPVRLDVAVAVGVGDGAASERDVPDRLRLWNNINMNPRIEQNRVSG